jgi:hypothetical protein
MRPGLLVLTTVMLAVIALVRPAIAEASANEMCETIRSDIATYRAMNRPCPCPYSMRRNGQACGNLSAWAKPDGTAPRCYFSDVTGERPPNKRPNAVRQSWPDPPPCSPTS